MFDRFYVTAAMLSVLAVVSTSCSLYGFVAEDNPKLRGPWGWQTVPDAQSCQSGTVAASVELLSEQACQLLLAHQARLHAPSLSAAIAIDGELVWSSAVGWADIKNLVPATPQNLYRIGSTSKPVTGTLLARMVEVGLVSLDEPISTYVDDLPNSDWDKLTLRQLASHMAGLPEYETNRDLLGLYHSMALRRAHTDVRQGLALFDDSPQRSLPGTRFEYSSFGTLLIATVLQEAAGKSFPDLMNQWVLAPLVLDTPVLDTPAVQRARFYQMNGNKAKEWRSVDLSNKLPGGGFMSRPEDLVRLGSAWLDPAFISEETRRIFWQPQQLANGEINAQSYALTWRWNDSVGYAHHGGVSKGSMAWLAVYPPNTERQQSLVIALTINTTLERFADFSLIQGELVELFRDVSTTYQYEESRLQYIPH